MFKRLLSRLFDRPPVVGIAEPVVETLCEIAKSAYPDEMIVYLKTDPVTELQLEGEWDVDGRIITGVQLMPLTETTRTSASVGTHAVANNPNLAGVAHSHPNGVIEPSVADTFQFSKNRVNIILGHPFSKDDWKAFDSQGERRELPVVPTSDLPDGFGEEDTEDPFGSELPFYDKKRS